MERVMSLAAIDSVSNWRGKIVLVRVDFNVPLEDGAVKDGYKIISALPTIRFLVRHKAIVVLVSHLGRPKGRPDPAFSLLPAARYLERSLRKTVIFVDQGRLAAKTRWQQVREVAQKLPPGGIMMLENIRFFSGEDDSESSLARSLAGCADVFVLDGFGVAHRAAASVSGVAAYLPSFAGLLLKREVSLLEKVMDKPRRPVTLVLGGAKVDSKIPLLKQFVKRADTMLIGGAIMAVYLSATGHKVGGMSVDATLGKELLGILRRAPAIMPVDAVVGGPLGENARVVSIDKNFSLDDERELIYDIGPKTLELFAKALKKSKTIIWNGAMGKFECKNYAAGTVGLVRLLSQRGRAGADVIVGGGETAEIVRAQRAASACALVSTGGGAMLEYLSGEDMPGIAAIDAASHELLSD